jgi:hypothetical protein
MRYLVGVVTMFCLEQLQSVQFMRVSGEMLQLAQTMHISVEIVVIGSDSAHFS